jgi:hypothetical protein
MILYNCAVYFFVVLMDNNGDGVTVYQNSKVTIETIAKVGDSFVAEIQYSDGTNSFQGRNLSGAFILNETHYPQWSNGQNKDGS